MHSPFVSWTPAENPRAAEWQFFKQEEILFCEPWLPLVPTGEGPSGEWGQETAGKPLGSQKTKEKSSLSWPLLLTPAQSTN